MKTQIRTTCAPFLESGFVRLPTEEGKPSIYALDGSWYTAEAIDSDGNTYNIYWDILDEFKNSDDQDEGNACNWSEPRAIVLISPDDSWKDVTDDVEIK